MSTSSHTTFSDSWSPSCSTGPTTAEASSSKSTLSGTMWFAPSSTDIPAASAASDMPPSTTSPPQRKKKELSGWKHSAAGSLGGMAGAIATSPFDVMKTRLQSDMFRHTAAAGSSSGSQVGSSSAVAGAAANKVKPPRGGMWHFVDTVVLMKRIGTEEGWRALYKGLGPTLVGIIPARAINFYFYPTSKAYLAKHFPNAPTTKPGQTAIDSPVIHLSAAVIAGIMTATGTNPIWVVKTRLQLSAQAKASGSAVPSAAAVGASAVVKTGSPLPGPIAASVAALSHATAGSAGTGTSSAAAAAPRVTALGLTMDILKKEGLPGLYRGLTASYLGVSEGVIQWVLYERFKRIGRTTAADSTQQSLASYITSIVTASGGAKAVASLITYPHEVIRTRLRQPPSVGADGQAVHKYKSVVQALKLILREEGAGALYGGLTAHMLRVVPNAACMFLIYELVAEKLGS